MLRAHTGDTVFLPRKVPPAGKMEDFFREVGRFTTPPIHEVLGPVNGASMSKGEFGCWPSVLPSNTEDPNRGVPRDRRGWPAHIDRVTGSRSRCTE